MTERMFDKLSDRQKVLWALIMGNTIGDFENKQIEHLTELIKSIRSDQDKNTKEEIAKAIKKEYDDIGPSDYIMGLLKTVQDTKANEVQKDIIK
jgi:hypothetical protein